MSWRDYYLNSDFEEIDNGNHNLNEFLGNFFCIYSISIVVGFVGCQYDDAGSQYDDAGSQYDDDGGQF